MASRRPSRYCRVRGLLVVLVFVAVDVLLYYRYRDASSSGAPPASPHNATRWLHKRKPFNKPVRQHPPNDDGQLPGMQAAMQQSLFRVASNVQHASSHLQPWSAWRNGRSASATAAVSMDDAPKHHQMRNAHKIAHKMKMMASMAQQNTLMYHHHHKESARDSSQAGKREDPTVILPTLIMNWRRRNAEEANGIIYPDWETKQQAPSCAWSMADANFKLPSNATLQGPLHRLVESPHIQPHVDALTADATHTYYTFAAYAECENMGVLYTSFNTTLQDALLRCRGMPKCTTVLFQTNQKTAKFCQGYRNVKLNPRNKFLIVNVLRGCEHYGGDAAITDRRNEATPFCRRGVGLVAARCPPELHEVQFSTDGPMPLPPHVVCSECPDQGICPELPRATWPNLQVEGFTKKLAAWPATLSQDPPNAWRDQTTGWSTRFGYSHHVYNPSIAMVDDRAYVAIRVSNSSRCKCTSKDNKWKMDRATGRWASFVAVCRMKNDLTDVEVDTCRLMNHVYDKLTMPSREKLGGFDITIDVGRWTGLEDPRAFGFKGKLYVMVSQNVYMHRPVGRNGLNKSTRTNKQMLLELYDDGSTARVQMMTMSGTDALRQKNWLPLVSHDKQKIYLVTSVFPTFRMCELDVELAHCESVVDEQFNATGGSAEVAHWSKGRGSTGFVDTPFGYLGMVHNVVMLDMGRMYSQKWVLLSRDYPHLPIWLSAPFRMPLTRQLPSEDIQFPAGMVLSPDGRSVLVSYGVHDCLSGLAAVPLPLDEMKRAHVNQQAKSPVALVSKAMPWARAPLIEQGRRGVVRWEGQWLSTTGISEVNRRLTSLLLDDQSLHLEMRTMYDKTYVVRRDENNRVFGRILSSNSPLQPDVVVRMGWQHYGPNLALPPSGSKLVMYVPWEFEAIPTRWVYVMNNHADEVWTTSEFCRQHFIRSGVQADKIYVIMHGIEKSFAVRPPKVNNQGIKSLGLRNLFTKYDPQLKFLAAHQFVFLYHGGLLWRKGIDRLIQAYVSTFTETDHVVLIIHYAYASGLNAQMVVADVIQKFSEHTGREFSDRRPAIAYLSDSLEYSDLVALYDLADVVVHPSRSEGWGLGVAEAMARGKAVVMSDYGASNEFTPDHLAYKYPAFRVPCTSNPCSSGSAFAFSQDMYVPQGLAWGDCRVEDLGAAMKLASSDPAEARRRGKLAKAHALANLTWEDAYHTVSKRLHALLDVKPAADE